MHAYMYIFACAYTCTHAHTCICTHALYIICAYTYYTFIYEYIPYNTHKYIIRIFSIVYLYVLCIIYIYILAITHKYVYIYNCLLNLQNKKIHWSSSFLYRLVYSVHRVCTHPPLPVISPLNNLWYLIQYKCYSEFLRK